MDTPESSHVPPDPEEASKTPLDTEVDAVSAPPPPAPPAPVESFAVTIGDIGVTRTWVVTPNGNAPVAGSRWIVLDQSRTEKKIPTWAIICAIVFALLA